jgi:hypothetical protein
MTEAVAREPASHAATCKARPRGDGPKSLLDDTTRRTDATVVSEWSPRAMRVRRGPMNMGGGGEGCLPRGSLLRQWHGCHRTLEWSTDGSKPIQHHAGKLHGVDIKVRYCEAVSRMGPSPGIRGGKMPDFAVSCRSCSLASPARNLCAKGDYARLYRPTMPRMCCSILSGSRQSPSHDASAAGAVSAREWDAHFPNPNIALIYYFPCRSFAR